MGSAENSADVAEDYRQALEDLSMNSRIEILSLTQIARENIKHALVISDVLQNHIKKVAPAKTLPALYVLDSIVKSVRTPYADFIGPKLYSLFMGAYAKVDSSTRRKMEEMLRTWKEPIPGFMDTKPVFPLELIRPIEMALLGARNAAMAAHQSNIQGQQQLLRGGRGPPAPAPLPAPASVPYRHTPTPPQMRPHSAQAGLRGCPPYPGPDGQPPYGDPYASHSNGPTPIPPPAQRPHPVGPTPAPYGQPGSLDAHVPPPHADHALDMDKFKDAIQQLAVVARTEFAMAPLDPSKQSRLQALLDLEKLIQNHRNVPQAQLLLIRDKVAELAVNMRAPPSAAAPYPVAAAVTAAASYPTAGAGAGTGAAAAVARVTAPSSQQHTPVPSVAAIAHPPSTSAAAASPAPPPVSIDSLFGQGALASLLAGPRNTPPRSANIPMPAVVPTTTATLTPTAGPQLPPIIANALAAARATPPPSNYRPKPAESPVVTPAAPVMPASSGARPATNTAAASSALPNNPSALLAMLRQSGLLQPTTPAQGPSGTAPAPVGGHADGRVAHLKVYRPHLISRLHQDLGATCSQCGRRFKADEEGRRKKTAHMDWHFRVHQRIAEAEKRGQHRSWYVDEQDWVNSREAVDSDYVPPQARFPGTAGGNEGDDMLGPSAHPGLGGRPAGGLNHQDQQEQHPGGVGGSLGLQYIPVPDDDTNAACPVCQERFDSQWLDEAQEWVWMDAVRVSGRVYHASCHREVTRDGGAGRGMGVGAGAASSVGGGYARTTPDPVLGKRKAEDEYLPARGKVKLESY